MYIDLELTLTYYVLPFILLLGFAGNAAFLIVVFRIPSMRTVTNYYLANLAVADTLFLSIVVVTRAYSVAVYGVPNDHLGLAGCVSDTFFIYLFHFAGLIIITFMSLERFIAVCYPLRHRLMSGRRRTVRLIVACWFMAVLLASLQLPSTFEFTQYCVTWPLDNSELYKNFPEVIGRCSALDQPWVLQMFHLTQTIPFFVAFFGSVYFYVSIVVKLNKRYSSSDRQQVVRTRNHVALMLVANGTVFFLTLTSFEVTSMILFIEGFSDDILIPYEVRGVLFEVNRLLLYINSAVNPIVYTVTNARYRRAFRRAFTPASWNNGRPRNSTIFSAFPEYYSQYHVHMEGMTSIPPSPPQRMRSPMVARPATYSNACFDEVSNKHEDYDIHITESTTAKQIQLVKKCEGK